MTKKRNRKNSDSSETGTESDNSQDGKPNLKTCNYCGKKFLVATKLAEHQKSCEHKRDVEITVTPDGSKKYVCEVCNQTFKYLSGLTKHEERHQPPGGFICRVCQTPFLTDFDRNIHKEKLHKMYKCQICESKFTDDQDYIEHIQNVHDGRDREYVVCTDCGQQFRTALQLKYHNESKCGTYKSYGCDTCGSKFMTQNTLNAHKLIHLGEKKHLCDYCGNSFLSKGQLKVHERSHTGEKPFKCEVCNKAFSYRESLVTHSSLHTGIKPYICEGCGSRFSCIGNLIKHRKARPDSCGLPQFSKNTKIAPRASAKNPGSLTMKVSKSVSRDLIKGRGPFKKKLIMDPIVNNVDDDDDIDDDDVKKEINNQIEINSTELNSLMSKNYIIEYTDLKNYSELNDKNFDTDGTTTVLLQPGIEIEFPSSTDDVEPIGTDNEIITMKDNSEVIGEYSQSQTTFQTDDYYNYVEPESNTYDDVENNWDQTQEVSFHDDDDDNNNDDHVYVENFENLNSNDINNCHQSIIKTELNNEEAIKVEEMDEVEADDVKNVANEFVVVKIEEDNSLDENLPLSSIKEKITKNRRNCQNKKIQKKKRKKLTSQTTTTKNVKKEKILSVRDEKKHKNNDEPIIIINNKEKLRKQKKSVINLIESDTEFELLSDSDSDFIPNIEKGKRKLTDNLIKTNFVAEDEHLSKNLITENLTDIEYNNKNADDLIDESKIESVKDIIEKTIHKCHLCDKMYAHKSRLTKHIKIEHLIGDNDDDNNDDENDDSKRRSKSQFECQYCDKKYFSALLLEKHVVVHGPEGILRHKCSCCRVHFSTLEDCDKHQVEEHKEKLYCQECNKMFKEPDGLQAHIRYAHKGTTIQKKYFYMCPQCGKNFTSKVALNDHERSNCGQSPIYKCNVCEKSYHSAGSLKTHKSIHSGTLPHLCNFCGKGFRTQGQVKVHERRHNGDKPYKCEFCPKSFAYRESLLTHRSLHTGLKRFMCQACGSRFSCISNLQAHRKSHKHTCGLQPNCTKAFGPMGIVETIAFNNSSSP